MRTMAKGKRVAALAAAAVLAMGGGAFGLSTYSANAYTMEEVDTLEARTPDSLPAMKTQGYRVEAGMINPNFEDSKPPISRLEYGGPWAFANIKDTVGWDKEDYDPYIAQYSTYQVVNINDAVNGMGKTAGQGDKITTALEITINTDNQDTLADALTYNFLDDMMWGEVAKEAFYFTAWVKAEQDMWFDVGMSFGAKEGHAQVYWDLGRRFFVPAGTWTQIGLDKDGNYLPFRAKVTEDGFKRGTGADPTAANSNCTVAPDESKGDTKIEQYYRGAFNGVWACIRLYAYSGATYGTSGVGAPAATHGLEAGDKYLVTGFNYWQQSAPAPVVKKYVSDITLNKTTLSLEEGKNETLTATVAPADADDKTLYWYSSDETIATVDENGKVTALKEGTVTITAEANDGNGAEASCAVTVTKKADTTTPGGDDNKPGDNKPGEEKPAEDNNGGGCAGSVAGFGALGLVSVGAIAAVTAIVIKRKKEN